MKHVGEPSLHIVQSVDWKDAAIALLEPRSPYRPWRSGTNEARQGDLVAYVFDTDPATVLTETARVGTSGDPLDAEFDRPLYRPTIMELSTLAMLAGVHQEIADVWRLVGADAVNVDRALDDCRYVSPPASRYGHSSMAAARTLMLFRGRCEGCEQPVDLTGPDARDVVVVHTVEPYVRPEPSEYRQHSATVDWPAVICRACRYLMTADGLTRFVDYKFSLHPPCPQCGHRRTRSMFFGEPLEPWNIRPWELAAGCCRRPERWYCDACDHEW